MKNLKIFSFILLLTFTTIFIFTFIKKDFDNAGFARVCYTYVGTNNSPLCSDLTISNFILITTPLEPSTSCQDGDYFFAFCFNNTPTTLSDALTILCNRIQNSSWPSIPMKKQFSDLEVRV